ncbi:MAG TPA: isoprenylcysteine carboxylmethyltransferase family protein [Candidatus Acidoferrum sp.]|nr:isoprenylcysteine carboxylmethyltransferase family protein [Candidatus Acidoferrum sp.]
MFLLKWIDFLCSLAFGIFVATQYNGSPHWFAGMALGLFGLAMWATARVQLGRSFSVTAQARKMVTTGIYSKIRNPIYFFAGVAYTGFIIAWGNWYVLFGMVFYFVFQFARAQKEAKVLEEAFGDEYRKYRAQTWF